MGDFFKSTSNESSSATHTTTNISEVADSYNSTVSSVYNLDGGIGNTSISTGGGGALDAILPADPAAAETTKKTLLIGGAVLIVMVILALFLRK